MGIIGMALGGGLEGLGEGGAKAAQSYQKFAQDDELEQKRQEAQAAREQSLARLQSSLKAQEPHVVSEGSSLVGGDGKAIYTAPRKPQTVAEGSTLVDDSGKTIYTAPHTVKPNSPDEVAKNTAYTNYLQAEADYLNRGKDKEEKTLGPKIKVEKDADGNPYMVDENSGALGHITPGTPLKKGETHWFSPNEPDKPAQPSKIEWSSPDGQVLKNGLGDLYPSLPRRNAGASTQPRVAGHLDTKTGEVIDDITKQVVGTIDPSAKDADNQAASLLQKFAQQRNAKPAAQPAAPSGTPVRTSDVVGTTPASAAPAATASPDSASGLTLDKARGNLSAANDALRGWGAIERARNPRGFAAAQAAVTQRQSELADAERAYNSQVSGDTGPYRARKLF